MKSVSFHESESRYDGHVVIKTWVAGADTTSRRFWSVYDATAAHFGFDVVYFPPDSSLLAVLPIDPSSPCHPMCEAHMVL